MLGLRIEPRPHSPGPGQAPSPSSGKMPEFPPTTPDITTSQSRGSDSNTPNLPPSQGFIARSGASTTCGIRGTWSRSKEKKSAAGGSGPGGQSRERSAPFHAFRRIFPSTGEREERVRDDSPLLSKPGECSDREFDFWVSFPGAG